MRRWIVVIGCIIMLHEVQAQIIEDKQLTVKQYFEFILAYHPVARQAKLLSENAQQELRMAKGAFDPKLEAVVASKEFQDKSYFSMVDAYLSVPTRTPLMPKIGFEQNKGELLNDIDKIPGDRQFLAGISMPIGKGFFTDERRTALKQAELLQSMAEADQVKLINKLLLSASKEYWNWYYFHQAYQLLDSAARLTEDIFKRVKISHVLGEASTLDTVQARITWQSRVIEKQEAYLNYTNSLLTISNYLWDENSNPVQLLDSSQPVSENPIAFNVTQIQEILEAARENHPELNKQQLKIQHYEFEKKLAREFLKPRLDVSYLLLSQPGTIHAFDPLNDYKLGIDFSIPVFLRKERSKLAITELKMRNISLSMNQQQREILTETQAAINQVNTTNQLIQLQQDMVAHYKLLMQGELLNLENGESDLFKINVQQEKLINAQLKLVKLKAEFAKQQYYVLWAAGIRNLSL